MNFFIIFATSLFINTSYGFIDKLELHQSIKQAHATPLIYKVSKKYLFTHVDIIDNKVCSVYSPLDCKSHNTRTFGFKLNTEHTWPQSKGAKEFPAKGDLHHLYISNKEANSKRANHPFCKVKVSFWERQGSHLGFDTNSEDCFEPIDEHKGNVARAMFYFSVRYKRNIKLDKELMFRKWNKLDPVDAFEVHRNDAIEKLQGNRNPFIDDETLVDEVESFKFY